MSYPNNITPANCRFITDNRLYVQGVAGANAFAVAPGTIVQLMDNEGPFFYKQLPVLLFFPSQSPKHSTA